MADIMTLEGTRGRKGRRKARRGRRGLAAMPPPLDFPPLEGPLDALVSPEQLRGLGISAGSGAAGLLAASFIVPKVPGPDWVKPLATGVLGILAGRLLWDRNREAALGIAGALTGFAVASTVAKFVPQLQLDLKGLSDEDDVTVPGDEDFLSGAGIPPGLPGVEEYQAGAEDEGRRLGDSGSEDEMRRLGGMEEVDLGSTVGDFLTAGT